MEVARAREIAESLHGEDREPGGAPLLAHIERVAEATRHEARPVAWLHESLECGHISEQDLLIEGLGDDELRALRLLCRSNGPDRDHVYLAHLDLIARAAGRSGDLARAVKIADLTDRCRHPRVRANGWSPPYARGLRLLLDAAGDQLSGPPPNLDPTCAILVTIHNGVAKPSIGAGAMLGGTMPLTPVPSRMREAADRRSRRGARPGALMTQTDSNPTGEPR